MIKSVNYVVASVERLRDNTQVHSPGGEETRARPHRCLSILPHREQLRGDPYTAKLNDFFHPYFDNHYDYDYSNEINI